MAGLPVVFNIDGNQDWAIPPVFHEFYLRWVHDPEWRAIMIDTVAMIAIDAFEAEAKDALL